LRAINAQGEDKTKEYIADKLVVIVEEVGPRNVVQIRTDNVANCKGAGLSNRNMTTFFGLLVLFTLSILH
jgi:hypothetical protein